MRHVSAVRVLVVVCACLAGLFAPACGGSGGGGPTPLVLIGVDGAGNLYTFSVSAPSTLSGPVAITGLAVGERVVGIDVRPLTGGLYGLAVDAGGTGTNARLLLIDAGTGATTPIGAALVVPVGDPGVRYGFDFNPTVDRIRVVNSADVNFRIDPNSGAAAPADTALNPAGQLIGSVAYDRNTPGGGPTDTTAYVLNLTTGMLQTLGGVNAVPSPNTGTLTNVGPLGVGVDAGPASGFDIAGLGTAPNGDALAILDSDPSPALFLVLYRINLATGAATPVGTVGTGAVPFQGFAIR